MRVQPKPFLSFLLNPLGTHARGMEYRDHELLIDARRGQKIHLRNLAFAPSTTKGFLAGTARPEQSGMS